jgi:alpha-1,2-mannosyltransferase
VNRDQVPHLPFALCPLPFALDNPDVSSWGRRVFALVVIVFAAINVGNALHKGGDFDVFLQAGQRVMDRQPLYEGSGPGAGVIGPPFQGVFFVPFAAVGHVPERAPAVLWYLLNLIALGAGVWWWTRANDVSSPGRSWDQPAVLLPLLAVILPAQTNFEHQNMNALLLGLTGAAAWSWTRGYSAASGALIGVAAALKAFPALLLIVFLVRRDWRALASGVLTGVALSASPALWYGPGAVVPLFRRWLEVSAEGGWPTRVQNQSIVAMTSRFWPDAATSIAIALIAILGIVLIVTIGRSPDGTRATARTGSALALALAIAVLASPIAWDHYWLLMLPALQAIYVASSNSTSQKLRWGFWIGAMLISGLAPLTLGTRGFEIARSWSNSTIAGLVIVITLAMTLWISSAPGVVRPKAHQQT